MQDNKSKWINFDFDGGNVVSFDASRTAHRAAQRWATMSNLLRDGDGDAASARIARAAVEPMAEDTPLNSLSALLELKRMCETRRAPKKPDDAVVPENSPRVQDEPTQLERGAAVET